MTPARQIRQRRPAGPAAATLALAAGSWVLVLTRMSGMDMGVATRLGSLPHFMAGWLPMMAAMMLPGAVPAVTRRAGADAGSRAVPAFLASYLAVWALVGIAVYAAYRPHGSATAGVIVLAAGAYEFTPVKQQLRRRCQQGSCSGLEFGLCCVGSSIGLMLMLMALGAMSITWMSVIAAVALAQKLLPARAIVDVPLALAIVGLGALIISSPSSIPGLIPSMS